MKRETILEAFVKIGEVFSALSNDLPNHEIPYLNEDQVIKFKALIKKQYVLNGWFTSENVLLALRGIGNQLKEEEIKTWINPYSFSNHPKKIAIIMAGNIPLVGFHDFLCVLMSGNIAYCKLSSDDKTLLPFISEILINWHPALSKRIEFAFGPMKNIDAVIATGSDNSLKYFETYFSKYPHLFRRNRTSIAILKGNETEAQMHALGHDIFDFYGLGCRNVSHVFIPENIDLSFLFQGIFNHGHIINHHKYGNNYDYQKAIHLMNLMPILDNNFLLVKASSELFSPLAILHYQFYKNESEITDFINLHKEEIQAIVGENYIPFGKAQSPNIADYADGVDTMAWLNGLVK